MINRGLQKTSQYVFNSETGALEKVDTNTQTIQSLINQANKYVDNLEQIGQVVNDSKEKQDPVNNIVVITAEDNIIHNYFYYMDVSWDASNCLSSAIIKMPKMDTKNINYWSTYTGQLTIYAGYNFKFDKVNSQKFNEEQEAVNSISRYWDNSNITPFFRGEVSRIKETQTEITIYVDSIGKRFQQKIPEDFRQAYIYNQNVRDAFQAICEFLGVKYICPPKTVTDNGEEELEEEGAEGDGDENNAGLIGQVEKKISSTVKKIVNEATEDSDEEGENEEEGNEEDALTNNEEIEQVQNGYGNINFDANGAIVHGSTVIETSPDMAETLIAMDENPLEKYLEDETGIVESVLALLNGDMFEELHNKVMNYDSITIEPKAAQTSSIESMGDGTTGATGENESDESSGGGSGFKWTQMSRVVSKYFNKNNPNKNTIIKAFRNCSNNWTCIANTYDKYKRYCSAKSKNTVIREIMNCFG